jgi:hypothetical protein
MVAGGTRTDSPPPTPPWRLAAGVAVLFIGSTAAFLAMLHQREALFDIDALYHFKVARLVLEQGPWVDIAWLPFTVLGEHGPDHHWLFHVLVAPLTRIGDDYSALAFACAVTGAIVPAALYGLLDRARAPWALLFALVAVLSSDLLPARFLALRAQNLAVVFTAAAVFALAARRTWWCALVAFLFTQAYHGAVILGLATAVSLVANGVVERKLDLRPAFGILVGVFLGLLASPWFPRNVDYLVFHTLFKVAAGYPGLVGTEWYPVPLSRLLTESWPAHAVLASGLAALAVARPPRWRTAAGADTLAFLALTAAFLVMYHLAWRFAEYYAPFAVMTAALLWRDALRHREAGAVAMRVLAAALAGIALWGAVEGARRIRDGSIYAFDGYATFMRHVDARDERPIVFNTRWSDFQRLFYWSGRSRFVAGLDGHYLLYGDPKRFELWYAISTGATLDRTDNARRIREAFGAGWVVVPRNQAPIANAFARDSEATLEMESAEGWLFRIKPPG